MDTAILQQTQARLMSLDALRGIAVLLMVLSGSISFGGLLPAWMYHAQVPPPLHMFNPDLPGITWVDWVFPFFLFSMGAAFPLALAPKLKKNRNGVVLIQTFKRYCLLLFFAIFIYHARAWVISDNPGNLEYFISISCFILLFLIFSKTNFESEKFTIVRKVIGLLIAILFLGFYQFKGLSFDLNKSDIIIVVLANMALFGSMIWIFTQHKPWLRVAILPLIMAVFISGKLTDSWTNTVFNWSPVPWAYTFYYLKYLFIIIPGTFAGEWLANAKNTNVIHKTSYKTTSIALLCLILIGLNTSLLFSRDLIWNLLSTTVLSFLILFLCRKSKLPNQYKNLAHLGLFLLVLGLFFEPYEGGIKKDPSTYSYYFVCTGLALLTMLSFILIESAGYLKGLWMFLSKVGQNPMIAYTAGSLLLLPLLRITHLEDNLNLLNQSAWGGFFKGIIFTTLVALITVFFTNKRIFWKT